MSALPWFAFDLEAYTANTMHLTTEEHGAYLLMMLAYYRSKKPLPATDRQLAALTKLPMDRWLECKPTLAAYFVDDGSHWRHERIEEEMLAASSKHTAAVAKAKAAAAAKWAKKTSDDTPSKPQASPQHVKRRKSPSSDPSASSEDAPSRHEASSSNAHKHKHTTTLSSSSSRASAQDDDDPTKAGNGIAKEESFNPLGTTLPDDWTPRDAEIAAATAYGLDDEAIRAELLTFHAYNAQHGTFSKNWSATWQMWCARWKEREAAKPKQAPPRVEVDHKPTAENWDWGCKQWARGNESAWPYRALGSSPGQTNCKCPIEILKKHHIDPQTGRVATPTKEPTS